MEKNNIPHNQIIFFSLFGDEVEIVNELLEREIGNFESVYERTKKPNWFVKINKLKSIKNRLNNESIKFDAQVQLENQMDGSLLPEKIHIYEGHMTDTVKEMLGDKLVMEQREGIGAVGMFVKLPSGDTHLLSRGDEIRKFSNGVVTVKSIHRG
jgi:hypothetical protein